MTQLAFSWMKGMRLILANYKTPAAHLHPFTWEEEREQDECVTPLTLLNRHNRPLSYVMETSIGWGGEKKKSATFQLPWRQIQSAVCFRIHIFSGEKIKKSFQANRSPPEGMRTTVLDKGQIGIPLLHILPDDRMTNGADSVCLKSAKCKRKLQKEISMQECRGMQGRAAENVSIQQSWA